MSRVVVCGSLNMDVVVQSARRPAIGETLLLEHIATCGSTVIRGQQLSIFNETGAR